MIEFECPYCQVRMNAPSEEVGKPERCPSCGYMIVVPALPPDLPATSRVGAWQSPRVWWGSNKRAVIIALPIVVAGLVAIYMFATYSSSLGRFPPRAEVEKMLAERHYVPYEIQGDRRPFEDGMCLHFLYHRVHTGYGERTSGISLHCDLDDPSIILAMSCNVMDTTVSLEPPDGVTVSEGNEWVRGQLMQTKEHTLHVWEIVEKLSSIKYDQSDMDKSRANSREGTGSHIYRKNGFSMNTGEVKYTTLFGRDHYLVYMTLKSEIQD